MQIRDIFIINKMECLKCYYYDIFIHSFRLKRGLYLTNSKEKIEGKK